MSAKCQQRTFTSGGRGQQSIAGSVALLVVKAKASAPGSLVRFDIRADARPGVPSSVRPLNAFELSQRLETGAKIFHDCLRLLPRGKVRACRMTLVVRQLGIGLFGPLPRNRADLLREGAYHDRDRDPLRSEECQFVFRIEACRRYPRVGQPVEGDVVETIVSRQPLGGTVDHASDLPVGPDIMIDTPRGQADRRILDPI